MRDVFYLRPIDPPVTPADVQEMAQQAGGCFGMYRVDWSRSLLSTDGGRMLCWYRAPDAESARSALRQLGSDMQAVWAGSTSPENGDPAAVDPATVVAECVFDAPPADADLERLTTQHDAGSSRQGATLLTAIHSTDRQRLVLVFRATDQAHVRQRLAELGHAPDVVWRCEAIEPAPQDR